MKIRKASVIKNELCDLDKEQAIRSIIDDFHKERGYFKVIGVMKNWRSLADLVVWIDSNDGQQISLRVYSVICDEPVWADLYWENVESDED